MKEHFFLGVSIFAFLLSMISCMLAIGSLSGCTTSTDTISAEPSNIRLITYYRGSGFYELTLEDGTICIATYEGGIDCNWK